MRGVQPPKAREGKRGEGCAAVGTGRTCVNLVCHVWQWATSDCLSGDESMRMKPTLVMPSSDWMSCCSSLYRVMSVSKAPSARFAWARYGAS